jgi:XTP/dITP diphosphohydrolase
MNILFATSNINKVSEIKAALPEHISLFSLKDIDTNISEIDEPYETLEENAVHKAVSYSNLLKMNCFSEDTGLEVFSLNGAPGVKSARYAGFPADTDKNMALLLKNLEDTADRSAQFRTVIALIINDQIHCFEGICKGQIIQQPKGKNGFGYDPIFIPDGANKTFAEMNTGEKNKFSHRKKAVDKMIEYLKSTT